MGSIADLIPKDKIYFTIGEISRLAQIPAYTLRYWESELGSLRPVRLEGGHRRYNRKDLEMILRIKELRYQKHFTLTGVKKWLHPLRRATEESAKTDSDGAQSKDLLQESKKEIRELLKLVQD
ncbi:MAG: MerR family transcriptional regulator [Elusimicrobia bacterium]|nr:MerR family transcriptional regulator [Elusimicrobiota bacterium]